jgi:hypothetical protein
VTPIPPSYLFRDLHLPWEDPEAPVELLGPPRRGWPRWGYILARLGPGLRDGLAARVYPARLADGRA